MAVAVAVPSPITSTIMAQTSSSIAAVLVASTLVYLWRRWRRAYAIDLSSHSTDATACEPSRAHPALPLINCRKSRVSRHVANRDALRGHLARYVGEEHARALLEAMQRPPLLTALRVNTLAESRAVIIANLCALPGMAQEHISVHPVLSDVITLPVRKSRTTASRCRNIVVVSRECGEAVLRGADVFAAGVRGCSASLTAGERATVIFADPSMRDEPALGVKSIDDSQPGWVRCGSGIAVLGRRDLFPPSHHAVNQQAGLREAGLAVRLDEPAYASPCFHGIMPSLLFLQNVPSALVAHALGPIAGERVLDMCAAPGGKATHCAALMGGQRGSVVAMDRSARRLKAVGELAERLGLANAIECVCLDATVAHERDKEGRERLAIASFDRVLLDPPCSALGVRPRFGVEASLEHLDGCAAYQRRLFAAAVALLKPGGVLTYSTCTTNPAENEEVVAHALRSFPSLHLEAPEPRLVLGGPGWPHCGLSERERAACQRWDPSIPSGEDHIGFFLARFRLAAPAEQ